MNEPKNIFQFYINPIKTTKKLLLERNLKWIYPCLIYMLSLFFGLIFLIALRLIYHKVDILSEFYLFFFLTVPFIFVLTLTGTIFFKEFIKNFQTQLYCSILIVSYDFVAIIIMLVIGIGLSYLHCVLSPAIAVLIILIIVILSRLIFNLNFYVSRKKIVWKSIIEIVLVVILGILIMGGISKII